MVLISLGLNLKEPRPVLHKRAIDAAVKAGVKHIVYTSFTGANTSSSPIARDHALTEEALRASGAEWTILRLGEYADRWVLGAARNMAQSGRAVQPPDERFSAPVTYADCAAAVVGAMLNPAAVNQVYEITGPEKVTQTDIARVTSAVIGRKIEVVAGKPGESRLIPMAPPPGEPISAPPPGGAEPNLPQFTPAQLAENALRFKQLTGRNPTGLKQMIEADRAQLVK
jgi:NAD(P)H dehydrogenase (quinone)